MPDTAENLEETEECRSASGGGGQIWEPEDFVDNLPNGGMEDWRDQNTPRGFAGFGLPTGMPNPEGFDFETLFKSPIAHTGTSSALLKNYDMRAALIEGGHIPAQFAGLVPQATAPAGVVSCKQDCPIDSAASGAGGESISTVSLPIDKAMSHIYGAYRGFISAQDQLSVNVSLARGDTVIGGTNSGPGGPSTITESTYDWITFALPFHMPEGKLGQADAVIVSAQVQPRGLMREVMTTGTVGAVSANSALNVDSFHFCDPADITIYRPKVLTDGKDVDIDETEEDTLGAQTSLNYDNDDQDEHWDHADPDGVAEDDELVRIRMILPVNSLGTARLNIEDVGDRVALWADEAKREPFTLINDDVAVDTFMTPHPRGLRLERNVWIEVLKPSVQRGDIEAEFVFRSAAIAGLELKDTAVLTALAIDSMSWEGDENSRDDGDDLDPDPNWPKRPDGFESARVFPGKRVSQSGDSPEAEPRDKVNLKVRLNHAPVRPVRLFLRPFDPDDPMATYVDEQSVLDPEDRAHDKRGTSPAPWGAFPDAANPDFAEIEMAEQEMNVPFQVTTRPGDNFQIAVHPDRDALIGLENDDARLAEIGPVHASKFVDSKILELTGSPGRAKHPDPAAVLSDVLVFWRKLFVEVDIMGKLKDTQVRASVQFYERVPAAANFGFVYNLTLNENLYAMLPVEAQSQRAGYVNNFNRGRLYFDHEPGRAIMVLESTANAPNKPDVLKIQYPASLGALDDDILGKSFTMVDDDPLLQGDEIPDLDVTNVETAFQPTFILFDFDTLEVQNTAYETEILDADGNRVSTDFLINHKNDKFDYLREKYDFDYWKHSEGDPDHWAAYALHAFQGQLVEDGDGFFPTEGEPDHTDAIAGQTDVDPNNVAAGGFGMTVFYESGRELMASNADPTTGRPSAGWHVSDVFSHEMAHLFGAAHEDLGLMSNDAATRTARFTEKSLAKIRSRDFP